MRPEPVTSEDDPDDLLKLRAINHLGTQMEKAVMTRTGRPIRMAGLLIGLVVLAGYLDVMASGFLTGMARDLYTMVKLGMVAGIVACLGQAFVIGRRMQQAHEARVQDIRDGKLCARAVLNARQEADLQNLKAGPPVEPLALMAQELAVSTRDLQAERALQSNFDKAAQLSLKATLEETKVVAPQAQPRRITLN